MCKWLLNLSRFSDSQFGPLELCKAINLHKQRWDGWLAKRICTQICCCLSETREEEQDGWENPESIACYINVWTCQNSVNLWFNRYKCSSLCCLAQSLVEIWERSWWEAQEGRWNQHCKVVVEEGWAQGRDVSVQLRSLNQIAKCNAFLEPS